MKFRLIPGRKKEGDRILLAQSDGEEAVTMIDVAIMAVNWYYNEENLYERPQNRGGDMFLDLLVDCIKEPMNILAVAQRYGLEIREAQVNNVKFIENQMVEWIRGPSIDKVNKVFTANERKSVYLHDFLE